MAAAVTQTHEFFEALWGGKPENLWILTWTSADKRSVWFKTPEKAANHAAGKTDCYVGCGLRGKSHGTGERGGSDDVVGIPGVWMDVDFQDAAAHKGDKYPADAEAALAFLETDLELKPSLVVHSGHGIQAWWLFAEPWIFDGEPERKQAAELSEAWQSFVFARGAKHGWRLDKTADLARVLRIPGTINGKAEPVEVRLLKRLGGGYLTTDVWNVAGLVPEELRHLRNGADEKKGWERFRDRETEQGSRNIDLTSALGKVVKEIRDVESESGRAAGWVAALAIGRSFDPPLDENEILSTFRSLVRAEVRDRAAEAAADEAESRLIQSAPEMAESKGGEKKLIDEAKKKLGNLPISAVYKIGASDSVYTIILENGTRLEIGDLTNQTRVRKLIMDGTKRTGVVSLPPIKGQEWAKVCALLVAASIEVESPDSEMPARAKEWLDSYLAKKACAPETNWTSAVPGRGPFVKDGLLHVAISSMANYLGREYPTANDVAIRKALASIGYRYQDISARVEQGDDKPSRVFTRGYWKGPHPES